MRRKSLQAAASPRIGHGVGAPLLRVGRDFCASLPETRALRKMEIRAGRNSPTCARGLSERRGDSVQVLTGVIDLIR